MIEHIGLVVTDSYGDQATFSGWGDCSAFFVWITPQGDPSKETVQVQMTRRDVKRARKAMKKWLRATENC